MDVAKFLETAKDRDVTVVFEKINGGGIRKMHCTLNPVLTEGKMAGNVESQQSTSDHIVVWALDKDAWRSFRVSTAIEWYEGEPKE